MVGKDATRKKRVGVVLTHVSVHTIVPINIILVKNVIAILLCSRDSLA